MRKVVTGIAVDLLLTKNESGFEEVIQAIARAERVNIVTYNLSKKATRLLDVLKGFAGELRLITKIPDRLNTYYTPAIADKACSSIRMTLERTDPKDFGPLARISFCFQNHAKIIMTETIAYVGSANYSDESANNWEAGVIVRDPDTLRQLESWVDAIESNSVRYYGLSMVETISHALVAHKMLADLGERFGRSFTTNDIDSLSDTTQAIEFQIASMDGAWREAEESTGPLSSLIDMRRLRRIQEWTSTSGLWELAEANERLIDANNGNIAVDYLLVDGDGNVPESSFHGHIEACEHECEVRLTEVRSAIDLVRSEIEELCLQIERACRTISTHIGRIDNTSTTQRVSQSRSTTS